MVSSVAVTFAGGCACGAIRYECSAGPIRMLNCHCRDCQLASGSAYSPTMIMMRSAVQVTKGQPTQFEKLAASGNIATRSFCHECGTPLFAASSAKPDYLGVRAPSLDDPSCFRPAANVWVGSAQPWDHMDPAIPAFERNSSPQLTPDLAPLSSTSHKPRELNPVFRRAAEADSTSISTFLQVTFDAFVAKDWSPAARSIFIADSSPDRIDADITQAIYAWVAESEDRIVGFLLMPRPTFVRYLFVHQAWHRRGIARALWEGALSYVQAHLPDVKTIELNSSPFAVEAYRALGFYPISEPYLRDGFRTTRMACWLPGRTLATGANEIRKY